MKIKFPTPTLSDRVALTTPAIGKTVSLTLRIGGDKFVGTLLGLTPDGVLVTKKDVIGGPSEIPWTALAEIDYAA